MILKAMRCHLSVWRVDDDRITRIELWIAGVSVVGKMSNKKIQLLKMNINTRMLDRSKVYMDDLEGIDAQVCIYVLGLFVTILFVLKFYGSSCSSPLLVKSIVLHIIVCIKALMAFKRTFFLLIYRRSPIKRCI